MKKIDLKNWFKKITRRKGVIARKKSLELIAKKSKIRYPSKFFVWW